MSFIDGSRGRNNQKALSSRASSASLIIAGQSLRDMDATSTSVDINVARNLHTHGSSQGPSYRVSLTSLAITKLSNTIDLLPGLDHNPASRSRQQTSNTWSSSEEVLEHEDKEDRAPFVEEYNRIARQYKVPIIVPQGFEIIAINKITIEGPTISWLMRKLMKRTSSAQTKIKTERHLRQKRSISDITLRLRTKKDSLKGKHLDDLVRLCGSSALYLPSDFAAKTLSVPTCFRATAQYLVQYGPSTGGILRISGSAKTVEALYNHYATQDDQGEFIQGTVRCPILPEHIKCDVHDVASAFKKFLGGLPSGILGSMWLFDALLSIHGLLDSNSVTPKTKQSKHRARLIALAIASVPSRFEREFMCAVIGLISMIGSAAEASLKNANGSKAFSTSELMNHKALSIVIGPLLLGELLDEHGIKSPSRISNDGQFHTTGYSPPKSFRDNHKRFGGGKEPTALQFHTEKIRLANAVTEMLLTHWKEVVRHMKSIGALKSVKDHWLMLQSKSLSESLLSESYTLPKPRMWNLGSRTPYLDQYNDTNRSPSPSPLCSPALRSPRGRSNALQKESDRLSVRRTRPKARPLSNQLASGPKYLSVLTPTTEERTIGPRTDHTSSKKNENDGPDYTPSRKSYTLRPSLSLQTFQTSRSKPFTRIPRPVTPVVTPKRPSVAPKIIKGQDLPRQVDESIDNSACHGVCHDSDIQNSSMKEDNDSKDDGFDTAFQLSTLGEDPVVTPGPKFSISLCEQTEERNDGRIQKSDLLEIDTPTEIAVGLLARRMRDNTISDPGVQPLSGFRALFPMSKALASKKRRIAMPKNGKDISSGRPQSQTSPSPDPLTKVSHQEDLASLASLAEVIESENGMGTDGVQSFKRPKSDEISSKSDNMSNSNAPRQAALPRFDATPSRSSEEVLATNAPIEGSAGFFSSYSMSQNSSRRPVVGSNPLPIGRGSVKALTARFNSGPSTTSPAQSPSPTRERSTTLDSGIVSGYTVNDSPSRTIKSWASERSIQSTPKSKLEKQAIEPLPKAKPTKSSELAADSSTLSNLQSLYPCTAKLSVDATSFWRPVHNDVERNDNFTSSPVKGAVTKGTLTQPPQISELNQTDVTNEVASQRQHKLGTILPHPDEPAVAQHINFARPSSTPISSPQPLEDWAFDNAAASPEPRQGGPSGASSYMSLRHKRSGTSILYNQIQNLQKQLHLRTEETEQLRRHFSIKGSLNELGTLSEQLRLAKREILIWRTRAETAERRLNVLTGVLSEEKGKLHVKDFENEPAVKGRDQSKRTVHGMDGASSDDDSEGTVRRGSAKRGNRNFEKSVSSAADDEDKENIPPSPM